MSTEAKRDQAQEVEPEVQVDSENSTEKLGSEGRSGMPDLAEKAREQREALKKGERSGVTGQFGTPMLFDSTLAAKADSAAEAAFATPLADKGDGGKALDKADKPAEASTKSPEAVSGEFEKKALAGLEEQHKNLKVTTDGSKPRVVDYNDKFKVSAEKTPMELAEEQLGPNATKDQKKSYARRILFLNDDFESDINTKKIAAGAVIKMPGQTADGGIFTKDGGAIKTEWVDGTRLDVKADGSGSASYPGEDGWRVFTKWTPNDKDQTFERRSRVTETEDALVEKTAYGRTIEKSWNEKANDYVVIKETTASGQILAYEYKAGETKPHKVTVTNPDKTSVEMNRTKGGEYISADGKKAIDTDGYLYSRSVDGKGAVTKSYDTDYKVTYDEKNRIIHEEGKDTWGRSFSQDYKAGEKSPHTIKLVPKEGQPPIEFKQGKGNKYSADYLDAGGKKIGKIELGSDSRIVYKNDKEKTQRTELKDGTTLEVKELPNGNKVRNSTKGAESVVLEMDKTGKPTKEISTDTEGRKVTKAYKGDKVDTVTIDNPDKSKTELKWDKDAKSFKGERTDASGKVVEKVTFLEDKFVYTDVTTGKARAEKYANPDYDEVAKFTPGEYDRDTGRFSYKKDDGTIVVESFSPGRTVELKTGGTWDETTVRGEKSYAKTNGEMGIRHADGSGIRINPDNTIDRWGKDASENALGEKMSPGEAKYLKDHPNTDKHDLAEIHKRFKGDNAKLDAFYSQLEKIDSAKNLTAEEKVSLRDGLMHHVANPEEIYQGRSPSCNVSVIQRDMAIDSPDKYVAMVVSAVSEGSITTADGTKVPLDPNNLKLADSSGRDLASRIFQTTAIQAEFYPKMEFKNTEDGVGRLYPLPLDKTAKPIVFEGMTLPEIGEARYRLTGQERGIALIENEKELIAAFKANGSRPMTIAVDGTREPFKESGPVGKGTINHVVTITGIDKGPPVKVYLQNQWGLDDDHSTSKTAVDASKLLANMRGTVKTKDGPRKLPGMVLTAGEHNKAYEVKSGKVVENPKLSQLMTKNRIDRSKSGKREP